MIDFIFEPTSFFKIAYTSSREDASKLADLMPKCFKKYGHFVTGMEKEGLYYLAWDCHKLDQGMPMLKLPFMVQAP